MKYDVETIYLCHIKQKIDLSASFAKNVSFCIQILTLGVLNACLLKYQHNHYRHINYRSHCI